MEKIMKWWAKITSLIIIFGVFYSIHLAFSFVELYNESQELYLESQSLGIGSINAISLNSTIFFVLTIVFTVIFGLIFYSPFFYYGWVKNPNNKSIKSFTKFMTILYSVAVIFGSIFSINKFSDILLIPIALILIGPLYYYAWKK
tara:strand:- start:56 stop:490 length:435 start_codon:yes stop_codon:yes gene_type:complete